MIDGRSGDIVEVILRSRCMKIEDGSCVGAADDLALNIAVKDVI
jgi:hypothetical protein